MHFSPLLIDILFPNKLWERPKKTQTHAHYTLRDADFLPHLESPACPFEQHWRFPTYNNKVVYCEAVQWAFCQMSTRTFAYYIRSCFSYLYHSVWLNCRKLPFVKTFAYVGSEITFSHILCFSFCTDVHESRAGSVSRTQHKDWHLQSGNHNHTHDEWQSSMG